MSGTCPQNKSFKLNETEKLYLLDVSMIDLTEGKEHDINMARQLELPKGSYVVFGQSYTDYSWYQEPSENSVRFVARLKSNAVTIPDLKHRGRKSLGVFRVRRSS